jgi:hypothetical protein
MPHMLRVSAGQIGDPVLLLILVKSGDGLRLTWSGDEASARLSEPR